MKDYLGQVRRVAQTDLYYLTLASALVIPDMCSGLEAADGKTTGALYQAWFDRYVAHKYVGAAGVHFAGQDCWGLRCAMLHQGRLAPHRGAYKRILFVEPHGGSVFHNNVMRDALNIDVTRFALDIVESAELWLIAADQTAEYQANYPYYMQRYPQGLAPYIVGVPVIA